MPVMAQSWACFNVNVEQDGALVLGPPFSSFAFVVWWSPPYGVGVLFGSYFGVTPSDASFPGKLHVLEISDTPYDVDFGCDRCFPHSAR